jgi:hypothetical protein
VHLGISLVKCTLEVDSQVFHDRHLRLILVTMVTRVVIACHCTLCSGTARHARWPPSLHVVSPVMHVDPPHCMLFSRPCTSSSPPCTSPPVTARCRTSMHVFLFRIYSYLSSIHSELFYLNSTIYIGVQHARCQCTSMHVDSRRGIKCLVINLNKIYFN